MDAEHTEVDVVSVVLSTVQVLSTRLSVARDGRTQQTGCLRGGGFWKEPDS